MEAPRCESSCRPLSYTEEIKADSTGLKKEEASARIKRADIDNDTKLHGILSGMTSRGVNERIQAHRDSLKKMEPSISTSNSTSKFLILAQPSTPLQGSPQGTLRFPRQKRSQLRKLLNYEKKIHIAEHPIIELKSGPIISQIREALTQYCKQTARSEAKWRARQSCIDYSRCELKMIMTGAVEVCVVVRWI